MASCLLRSEKGRFHRQKACLDASGVNHKVCPANTEPCSWLCGVSLTEATGGAGNLLPPQRPSASHLSHLGCDDKTTPDPSIHETTASLADEQPKRNFSDSQPQTVVAENNAILRKEGNPWHPP
eukprot:m.485747 g.485747  ORF g.485747 m.485747 type:complete len:124 (+) comp75411_c0_seq1:444-815(+)